MPFQVDEAFADFEIRFGNARRELRELQQRIDQWERSASRGEERTERFTRAQAKMGSELGRLQRRLLGVVAALGGFAILRGIARAFLGAADEAEGYRLRLVRLLGSQKEGNQVFQDAAKFAGQVLFEYREVMASATQLAGVVKGGAREIATFLPLIGDLAAVSGLNFQQTTEQVVRMISAGAGAADLFRERGILAMLGFQAGVATSAAETRRILFREWTKADSQFRGAAGDLANTWTGLMSMFADRWFQFRTLVAEKGIFDALKAAVRGVLDELNEMADTGALDRLAQKMSDAAVRGLEGFGKLLEVLGKAINFITEHPLVGQFGLVGLAFLGKKGAVGLAAVGLAIDDLIARLAGPATTLAVVNQQISDLQAGLARLKQIRADFRRGVIPDEARVIAAQLNVSIEDTEAILARLNGDIAAMEAKLGQLNAQRADHGDVLQEEAEAATAVGDAVTAMGKAIQDAITALKEGKDTTDDQADAANRAAAGVRELEIATARLIDTERRRLQLRGTPGFVLDEFEQQARRAQQALRETLGLGGAGALGPAELAQMATRLRELARVDEERAEAIKTLQGAQEDLVETLEEIRDLEKELTTLGRRRDAASDPARRRALEEQYAATLEKVRDKLVQLGAETQAVDRALAGLSDQTGRGLGRFLTDAEIALRSVNRLGDAFGFLDDDVRRAIDSALDLVRVLQELRAGEVSAGLGVAGIVSAGIGILGGFLGALRGGPPSALERATDANTKALRELTNDLDKLAGVVRSTAGADLTRALEILARDLTAPRAFGGSFLVTEEELALLERLAQQVGITLTPFEVAGEGIRIIGDQATQLAEALRQITAERLLESFTGQLDLLRRSFEIFDVDDPMAQLEQLIRLFIGFTDVPAQLVQTLARPGAFATEAGRAQLQSVIEELFRQLQAGDFDLSLLGQLSLDEFLDLLGEMERLLDEIEANTAEGTEETAGQTTDFVRSSRITEAQGSQLLSILDTMLFVDRAQLEVMTQIRDNMLGMPPIPAPAAVAGGPGALLADAIAAGSGPTVGTLTVNVGPVAVAPGEDPARFAERLAPALLRRIDEGLAELRIRKRRSRGQ